MVIVYKTLNSISKKAYHVFVQECVVDETLKSSLYSYPETLNSNTSGISFLKIRVHHILVQLYVVYKSFNSEIFWSLTELFKKGL